MAIYWSGAEPAQALLTEVKKRAENCIAQGVTPTLALLCVGDDPAAAGYRERLLGSAESTLVAVKTVTLAPSSDEKTVRAEIERLNADRSVHGILVFLPLPHQLHGAEKALCAAIKPEKDVDGVTPLSAAGTYLGKPWGFTPCAAEACIRLLDYYGFDCSGKKAVVVGRSAVIGKPAAMLLLEKNATVTVCHRKTRDLAAQTRQADILLTAAGSAGLIGAEHIRPGAVVLDLGASWEGETLVGDLQPEASSLTAAYTPVPGGVGAVTSAVLMDHVVRAAETA